MSGTPPDFPMWNALLRWSLAQGGDGTTETSKEPMSAEDREFLENVMKSMTVDVSKKLGEELQVVVQGTDDDRVNALKEIEEMVLDLDIAKDFCKLGGHKTMIEASKSEDERVRIGACGVVAALAQNEPTCQDAIGPYLPDLYRVFKNAQSDEEKRVSFGAASAVVRGHQTLKMPPAVLLQGINSDSARASSKALFLLSTFDTYDDDFSESYAAALNVAASSRASVQSRESATRAVVAAVSQSSSFRQSHHQKLKDAASSIVGQSEDEDLAEMWKQVSLLIE